MWRPPGGSQEDSGLPCVVPQVSPRTSWPLVFKGGRGGPTGRRGCRDARLGSRSSGGPLTEIGRLHGVVEVFGRPRGHAVGTPDPRGQGAASRPVGAGPRPRLMSQNVHQSPRGGRGMGIGPEAGGGGGAGRGGPRPLPPDPVLPFGGSCPACRLCPLPSLTSI